MKKTILTTVCAALMISLMAQVPQGISHQAVIRNAENQLVTNLPVGIRVGILQGTPDGTEVFSETHTPQSNANGLITFVIGQGANQSSDFSAIDWANGPYFIETKADPEGGTNYTIEGVSQLWSVPYALSASTNFSVGDSLVLKDNDGMTRFVLNPNTGTFKMMNNDTTWYSLEVKSPAKQTGIDYYGRYYEKNPVSGTTTFYSDASKEKILEERTDNIGIGLGLISEVTKYYDNGNEKYYEKHEQIEPDPNPVFKSEYITYNEDGIINKWVVYETDASGKVLKEMVYYENKKQSETTNSSSTVPGMGTTSSTCIGRLFDANEDIVQETTQTTLIKATELENYLYKTNELKRFVGGVLLGKTKETDKLDILPDGSVTKISNKITEAEGLYTVLQKKEENGIQTEEKLFQNNPDLPGGGGTLRLEKSFTHDDNLSGLITKFNNPFGNLVFIETKTADRSNNSITTTVEAPSQGSTSIKQNDNEIEFNAPQVVTEGNHYVTGEFGVVGDFGASISNDLNVFGNSNVEGDQEVGGNLSTLLDMIAKGKKKFRIDHPQFPDTKFLQHASIESNEVLNLYSGNVETDIDGNATVTLPDYFDLINIDFRYQLTVIGATFARAIIFSEIDENNQFVIKTDEPNTKVSWQVTAKRNDQYLIDNPFSDVVDK